MPYVYSTATANCNYCIQTQQISEGKTRPVRYVTIKGNTGVALREKGDIVTHLGVATKVSKQELELLKQDEHGFMLHHRNGFITWQDSDRPDDPEKIAASSDMKIPGMADGAPMSEQDLKSLQEVQGLPDDAIADITIDGKTRKVKKAVDE